MTRCAPKQPEVACYRIGSLGQARFSVGPQHDLWRDPGVRTWLQQQLQLGPKAIAGSFDDTQA